MNIFKFAKAMKSGDIEQIQEVLQAAGIDFSFEALPLEGAEAQAGEIAKVLQRQPVKLVRLSARGEKGSLSGLFLLSGSA